MKSTVLIISGWAHGLNAIEPMGKALSDTFDVTLMPGDQILKDRQIPETNFIVTGSMGGLLAMEYLPSSCQKLVLISSTAKFCSADDYLCGTEDRIMKRMILQMKKSPDAVLNEFYKNVHYPQRQSRQAIELQSKTIPQLNDLVGGLEYLRSSDVRKLVQGLTIPTLIMHGMDDLIIPVAAAEWLHTHLSESKLKVLENAGHALPAHQFSSVMTAIKDFLI